MTKMNKEGSGEELGRIEINDEVEWVISDDGDPDPYVNLEVIVNGQIMGRQSISNCGREAVGDEQFMKDLENIEGDNYESIL